MANMLVNITRIAMQQSEVYILPPLCTRERFAAACGLEIGVFVSQCEKSLWPQVKVGKRILVNVEAIRLLAAKKAEQFTL
jgi:hypothetical protein